MTAAFKKVSSKAGLGLRSPHFETVLTNLPSVHWFEVHPENLKMGATLRQIEKVREHYPLSLHGVGLSLGSQHLDKNHLRFLKNMITILEPALVSEHVAWTRIGNVHFNDFLPLPYTEESLALLIQNVLKTQDFLGRQILMENPSTYMEFAHSTIPEWEFIRTLAQKSGCKILLDVNNIFVSSTNHGWDPHVYLQHVADANLVGEIHLAGHAPLTLPSGKTVLVDSHNTTIIQPVWQLYEDALSLLGPTPTLIEWDVDIPDFTVLIKEFEKAEQLLKVPSCT